MLFELILKSNLYPIEQLELGQKFDVHFCPGC